jgi:hypothetical protein
MAENEAQQPDEKDAALAAANQRIQEYERHLLDPAYLEFLAGNRREAVQQAQAAQPSGEDVDFDRMSNKELVQYIVQTMRGDLQRVVQPINENQVIKETKDQVKEAAARHEDYWEYQQEMIALARKHPTLTAEDAYWMAKGQTSGSPKPKPRRTETPTGGASTAKAPPVGFDAKFAKAWEQAGIKGRE